MDAKTRRKLSMATRALDFSNANPSDLASITMVVGRLDTLVNSANEMALQQRSGSVGQAVAVAQRNTIRFTVRRDLLTQLSRLAATATKDHPELADKYKMPPYGITNRAFLVAAQEILASAITDQTLLQSLGLGETVIADLTAALAAADATTTRAHAGRDAHIGASKQITGVVLDAVKVVGMLDALNRVRFKDDSNLLAAWISASKVRSAGGKSDSAEPPAVPPPAEGGKQPAS